jgi:hypothetical protein
MARPTATRVAGFRAWRKLGYAVQRGERAIKVWAPCPRSRKQLERWQQDGGDPDQRPRTYFRLAPVFAQDQLAPLPPPAEPAPLELPIHDVDGDELAPIIPKLDALAHELGCPVEEEPMSDGCHGYYEIHSGRIAIDTSLSANGKVKTHCHELAHALIRRERQDGDPELDRASEELVVADRPAGVPDRGCRARGTARAVQGRRIQRCCRTDPVSGRGSGPAPGTPATPGAWRSPRTGVYEPAVGLTTTWRPC